MSLMDVKWHFSQLVSKEPRPTGSGEHQPFRSHAIRDSPLLALVWSLATFPTGMQPQVEVAMDGTCLSEVY